jgi:hypothetical protein
MMAQERTEVTKNAQLRWRGCIQRSSLKQGIRQIGRSTASATLRLLFGDFVSIVTAPIDWSRAAAERLSRIFQSQIIVQAQHSPLRVCG